MSGETPDLLNGVLNVDPICNRSGFQPDNKECGFLGHIRLIEDKSDLQYQAIPYDRRGFFGALKKLTMEGAASLLDSAADQNQMSSYGDKVLPLKRRLLNSVLSVMIEKNVPSREDRGDEAVLLRKVLNNYYYNLVLDNNCDKCFACAGMCPTGALKGSHISDDEQPHLNPPLVRWELKGGLLFDTSFCSGCGLCSDFCSKRSISVKQGFSGTNSFEDKNRRDCGDKRRLLHN